jgi:hypothetical protein
MNELFKRKVRRHYFIDEMTGIKRNGLYGGGGQPSGGGGGGTQTTQTVQKSDPWSGQQPYLSTGFSKAQNEFLDTPPAPFFPGSTVVPFSPQTQLALQMQENRAINGSPIQTAGTDQLTRTLNGDYLNNIPNLIYNNPYQSNINQNLITPTINGSYLHGGDGFNAAYNAASNKIIPQVQSQFEQAGRTNSGLAQTAETQALADAFASQYGQERQNQLAAGQLGQQQTQMTMDNLNQERQNEIRSMLFAPQMASLDYNDISMLAQVGSENESQQQQQLNEDISRYDYSQNAPKQNLVNYMNLIQGNYGGQATGSSTSNLMGSDGGGGGGGFGMGSLLMPMLFGGFGGGGGGLLGSLFGGLF